MAKMKVELKGDAVTALARMAAATGRTPLQVVSDALKVYSWILEQQEQGKVLSAEDPATSKRVQIGKFLVRSSVA